jgi:PAS domain S-box-containing protein
VLSVIDIVVTDLIEANMMLKPYNQPNQNTYQLLGTIFENTHMLVAYLDAKFNFVWVNRAYAEADELTPDFFPGKNHFDLYPNEENKHIFRNVVETGQAYLAYEKPFEYAEHPERSVSYWDWSLVPTKDTKGSVTGLVLTLVDVTERVRAQDEIRQGQIHLEQRVQERTADLLAANQALKKEVKERQRVESQLRLQTLAMETAANGIIITDRDANIIWANPAFYKISGYPLDEVIGQNTRILKSGRHPSEFYAKLWKTITSGQVWQGEMINRRKDGQPYFEEQTISPVQDSHGEITHFIAIKHDITHRKQAQRVLEDERRRLFNLLNELPAIIYLKDPDYKIRFANKQFISHFGTPAGENCYEIVRGQNRPCAECPTRDILRERAPRMTERQLPDGCIYQLYDYPFVDVDGTELVLQLGIDITERKQAQAELEKRNRELLALSESERSQRQIAEGLLQASIALNSSLDLDDVLDHILAQIQRVIPFSAAGVMLVEDEMLWLVRVRGLGDAAVVQKGYFEGFPIEAYPLFIDTCRNAKTVSIPDLFDAKDYVLIEGLEWIRSVFAAPLVSGEKTVGLIALLSDKPEFFTDDMIAQLEGFVAQAAFAIHNARLYQAELAARHTSETLSTASLALTQSLQLDNVLETLMEYVERLVPYHSGVVVLRQGNEDLQIRFVNTPDGALEEQDGYKKSFKIEECHIIQTVIDDKKLLLIKDIRLHADWESFPWNDLMRSWMGIPLLVGGAVIGVFCIANRQPDFFTQGHLLLAEALVRQASVAVQNALLFEQVRVGSERLQALSRRLVEVQENERRYVARELHDEASQALSSLKIGLRLLEAKSDQPQAIVAGIGELKQSLEMVMENLHRLAMNLRPASLDHLGLVAALRQHAQWVRERDRFQVQFETVGISERLPVEVETALYRITQEALANIQRHARATQAGILLERRGDKIVLIVEDNGIGFDPTLLESNERLGIFGMRERAEMLGAEFSIESTPGIGTSIFVEVPHDDTHLDRR